MLKSDDEGDESVVVNEYLISIKIKVWFEMKVIYYYLVENDINYPRILREIVQI